MNIRKIRKAFGAEANGSGSKTAKLESALQIIMGVVVMATILCSYALAEEGPAFPEYKEEMTRREFCQKLADHYGIDTRQSFISEPEGYKPFSDENDALTNALHILGIIKGAQNDDGTISFNGNEKLTDAEYSIIEDRAAHLLNGESYSYNVNIRDALMKQTEVSAIKKEYNEGASDIAEVYEYIYKALPKEPVVVFIKFRKEKDETEAEKYVQGLTKEYVLRAGARNLEAASYCFTRIGIRYANIITAGKTVITGKSPISEIRLTLSLNLTDEEREKIAEERAEFNRNCKETVLSLLEEGKIQQGDDRKAAQALADYVCKKLSYDSTGKHITGYDAITTGKGNCQSYTTMYSRLCQYAGIPVKEYIGGSIKLGDHAWNIVEYPSETFYVDVTWQDNEVNGTSWFWQTKEFFRAHGHRFYEDYCLNY